MYVLSVANFNVVANFNFLHSSEKPNFEWKETFKEANVI